MRTIIGLLLIATVFMVPAAGLAFAAGEEPGEYLDRRVEIWNLFYRMMTVAFTVGAVVSGVMIWQCWRFRESHPKATPTKYEAAGEW